MANPNILANTGDYPLLEYQYLVDIQEDGSFTEDITRYVKNARIFRGVTFNTGNYPVAQAGTLDITLSDYNLLYYPFNEGGEVLPVSLKIKVLFRINGGLSYELFVGWIDRTDYTIREKRDSIFKIRALGILSVLNAIPYSAGFQGSETQTVESELTKYVVHHILSGVKLPINIIPGVANADNTDNDILYLPRDTIDTTYVGRGTLSQTFFSRLGIWFSENESVLQAIRSVEIAEVGLVRERADGQLVFESNRFRNRANLPRFELSTDISNTNYVPILDVTFPQTFESVSKKVKVSLSNITLEHSHLVHTTNLPTARGQGVLLDVKPEYEGESDYERSFNIKLNTKLGVRKWTGAIVKGFTVWDPRDPSLVSFGNPGDRLAWGHRFAFTGGGKNAGNATVGQNRVNYRFTNIDNKSITITVTNDYTYRQSSAKARTGVWVQIQEIELYADQYVETDVINRFRPKYGAISWKDEKPLEVVAKFLSRDYSVESFAGKIFDRFSAPAYRPILTIDARMNERSARFCAEADISDLVNIIIDLPNFSHTDKYYIENITHDLPISGRHLTKVQLSRAIV